MSKNSDSSDNSKLLGRIADLEAEVKARESDLAVFRQQLGQANSRLEALVGKMSEDLRVAAQIQKILVPTEFPNIPGFEFSTKFVPSPISGGDYFDIFEHEDRMKFGLVLSSANGYGMSALLLSVLLRMTGNHDAKRGLSPEKVIQSLALELDPGLGAGPNGQDRAHVFYGVIDRRNLELTYATAGAVYGGVLRAATGKIERLIADAGPIEKGSHAKLGNLKTIGLEAKDRIFLVSPGAVAARNAQGEAFGEEQLVRAVLASPRATVHDWRNEILYRIEKHVGAEDLPADVTAIVVEVKDRVIRLAPRR